MFSCGNRKIENIPPTQAALLQHMKQAAYQAVHVWGQALNPDPSLPSPSEWEKEDEQLQPFWTRGAVESANAVNQV